MPSRCHCHSLSLAPVNPDWFYPSWFYLSGTGSPRYSRTQSRGHRTVVVEVLVSNLCINILHQKIKNIVKCNFWYQLTQVVPDKVQRTVKWLYVCVCVHQQIWHCIISHSSLGNNIQCYEITSRPDCPLCNFKMLNSIASLMVMFACINSPNSFVHL